MSRVGDPVFTVQTPEQLRAISDPFRQRLVGAFAEPATAKAAAARLGVPVGRLYHHLDRLQAAGFLKVVGERRRRGAVERTFQAAAPRIAVGPAALAGGAAPAATHPRSDVAHQALDRLLGAIPPGRAAEQALKLAQIDLMLTPTGLGRLEAELGGFLKRFETDDGAATSLLLFVAAFAPGVASR